MNVKVFSVIAAALSIGVGAAFASIAMGRIGKAAVEGMARQPEASRTILTAMLISCALVEALCIYALLVSILLLAK